MALKGIKVLEFAGLAPGPFCGKILADFGASVTRIDKAPKNTLDVMQHGKRTLAINLKDPKGQSLVRRIAKNYDVLIEPFRPGVMERLNLGPELLCEEQPRLIYARLTGFGQHGRLAQRAGHDINYAAISGVLSMLGGDYSKPTPPVNILADFAGGGLMCAMGICLALLERHRSGHGQIIDAAMVDGAAYVASWLFMSRQLPVWQSVKSGKNILDGGSYFYDTYQTKDGRFMSVGALEPQFFDIFKNRLGEPQLTQFVYDEEERKVAKEIVCAAFLRKTQSEWSLIFEDVDACVYPVLDWQNPMHHDHNNERNSFNKVDGIMVPKPAPRLSRTPGKVGKIGEDLTAQALSILGEINFTTNELQELVDAGVLLLPAKNAKL